MPESNETAIALRQPASIGEVFRVFNRLALQGFGGVLAVAQHELVERENWLSREQFLEMLAIAQVLPGPNVINMSLMLGDRYFGWRGAAAALLGLIGVPMLIVLLLAALYGNYRHLPVVAGALRGMGAVAAGLVIGTGLKLIGGLRGNALGYGLGLAFAAATLLTIGVLRWPLAIVLLILGPLAVAAAWWRLKK